MNTPPRTKVPRRPVHGVLLLNKPQGLSSNQALQRVKWLLRAEKAGHTGTLDPMATGALPLCFGAATKFSQIHLDADKSYEALVCLGVATDSGDAMGQVVQHQTSQVLQADVDLVMERFTGGLLQTPPMYSALKKDGKALYEYARDGIDVPREPRAIHIYALKGQLAAFTPSPHDATGLNTQILKLQVDCSKGTYIRTLGEDIAKALGTVGHLIALKRTTTGPFSISSAIGLDQLEQATELQRAEVLQPVDVLLNGYRRLALDSTEAGRFLSGLRRRVQHPDAPQVAVYGSDPHTLLGTAHIVAGELIPDRLLNPQEITQIVSSAPASIA